MKKQDVIDFFGSASKTARALGMAKSAITSWKEVIPASRWTHVQIVMEQEQKRREEEAKKEARKARKKTA